MGRKQKHNIITYLVVLCALICSSKFTVVSYAAETDKVVDGKVYEFDEKNNYDYLGSGSSEKATASNSYGSLILNGNFQTTGTKDGYTSYIVDGSAVSITYKYNDSLLNAGDDEWHVIDDKSKKVAGLSLDSNVLKGAIILQTSKDGETWLNDVTLTNAFADTPIQNDAFYEANNIQLSNGCYYRVIIAYEVSRKVGQDNILFVKTDKYEYSKKAEVYEFYLQNTDASKNTDNRLSKNLGTLTKTSDSGYTGSNDIGIKDPHYGWEIGKFFVSGYTRDTKDDQSNPVFLKNVGDEITLWFNLQQDITNLNGKKNISISEDKDGYDQYFQTKKTDMGHGTLIIRYTDSQGVKHDPEIYTNYLEANASTSADTIVKLFEEGDYEVALDYEIKNVPRKVVGVEIIPEYSHYRISFEFSVRNGNCMVYPFDTVTLDELQDEAITMNGFKLDMARSKYLTIDVQRSVVTEGANGYVEDVRFNRPAKDGDSYNEEGIYTFNVRNLYTGENTTKTIYVGSSNYMNALSVNKISVEQLNTYIADGAILNEDGSLVTPEPIAIEEDTEPAVEEIEQIEENPSEEVTDADSVSDVDTTIDTTEVAESSTGFNPALIVVIVVLIIVIGILVFRNRNKKDSNNQQEENQ